MNAREYRRLLGLLLLWATVPLPFLYIVLPPFWLVAMAVGLLVVVRPDFELRLSGFALNAVGFLILIVVVAAGGLRIGPLRPLGHLLLLLTSVRLVTIGDRRTFFRALLPVALVWIVSMTSSTHLVAVLYFAVSAVVWWWAGMRVLLAGTIGGSRIPARIPRFRHAAVGAAAALLVAALVFVLMPRLREPWIAGRGGGRSMTGFRSHVELGGVGTIEESPAAAMVVRTTSGEVLEPRWMRLRATALERVTLDSWSPRAATRAPRVENGLVWLYDRRWAGEQTVELEIELLRPRRYLFLPEGSVALWSPAAVRLDPANGVALAVRTRGPLRYRVLVTRGEGPRPADPPPASLRTFTPEPEVRRLALDIVQGLRSDAEKAAAVERYLRRNYRYSTTGMLHLRSDPVAWFLLEQRAGHCEYFAGAMVALLSELGIPARMVTGYSGGDLSDDGTSAVVRESNAHAWVEARVGRELEWRTFDPTPSADVPALRRISGRERVRWALDWVQSAWDRYVLTYGFSEQTRLLSGALSVVLAFGREISWRLLVTAFAVAVVLLGTLRAARRVRLLRPPQHSKSPAGRMIQRLARRLHGAGIDVPRRATIRWIAGAAGSLWPRSRDAVDRLARVAERELYDVRPPDAATAEIHELWRAARRGMRS